MKSIDAIIENKLNKVISDAVSDSSFSSLSSSIRVSANEIVWDVVENSTWSPIHDLIYNQIK